ncbi:PDZ domain-containing protein 11-like isoform X2 [Tubulanus polymorphus]|uniref:PDZ domain-containing protein 11-like isoform X2 n=1 Tax=Tubulanus polymorphus TaxID=672921 RepID=UPI003DA3D1B0
MYPSHRELIKADLPPYEHPPAWIPSHQRENNPTYESNIHQFLPRTVFLKRSKASDQLGFNVRGGKEFHCGVFISKVVPGSGLEKLGLRQGDQIMSVNDQSFENIAHSEAVRILKMNTNIEMIVSLSTDI